MQQDQNSLKYHKESKEISHFKSELYIDMMDAYRVWAPLRTGDGVI